MTTTSQSIEFGYPLDLTGYRVFVIGGGTSLIGFDFSLLEGEFKIGANLAAVKSRSNMLVSIDRNFIRNYRDEIAAFNKQGLALLGHPMGTDFDRIPAITGVMHMFRIRGDRLDVPHMHLCGTNSGWAAFQLAVSGEPSEIHLLGFDFRFGRHGKHFFGRYRHGSCNDKQIMSNWVRSFEVHAKEIERRGIRVTNWVGDPVSKIDCFETRQLEDMAEWLRSPW